MLNKIRQVSLIPELRFPSKRYAGFHYSGFMVYFAPVYSTITPFENGGTFKYTLQGRRLCSIFFPDAEPNLVKLDPSRGMHFM